ncbi:ABC transporter permease [Demequina subtropica]|uniref:ABC transporter permease n=1 Tax=Demequina subtropica TaxID=1638989 RepID=UPI000785A78E|nr:ABC transporter permease [Demequina subtropica]
MIRFIARRGVRALGVLLLVAVLAMSMPLMLPGSPAMAALGLEATDEEIAAFNDRYNLGADPLTRLWNWLDGLLHGDLGTSIITDAAVTGQLAERLPVTLELVAVSLVLALVISLPVALRSAWRPGSILDRVSQALAFVLLSMPGFVLGMLLIYVFAVVLRVLPATGWVPFSEDPLGHLTHLILPVTTMALAEAAVYLRALRADADDVLESTYIHAAQARGMKPTRLLLTRALRPASLPLVTLVGLNLGMALGGTLVVETMYAIPGMGRYVSTAIGQRDYPVIESTTIILAAAMVTATLLVDLSYRLIDPRIAHDART